MCTFYILRHVAPIFPTGVIDKNRIVNFRNTMAVFGSKFVFVFESFDPINCISISVKATQGLITVFRLTLQKVALSDDVSLAGSDTVLGLLYGYYNENHPYDNEEIKADFNELYRLMNGMPLREVDKIIYPVCKLCREHEKAGFTEGVKIGIRLANEFI